MLNEVFDSTAVRKCPLCDGNPRRITFPYKTVYEGATFNYIECDSCYCSYVDPYPDIKTLSKMYSKSDYHDHHYANINYSDYESSANLLLRYLNTGASILDYGAGSGAFLTALSNVGFIACGVEFNKDAAINASIKSGCKVYDLAEFEEHFGSQKYDAIHFGDVLEHLSDPFSVLNTILKLLKPGGVLFVEGPLENNPSPVYYSSKFFGIVKHIIYPEMTGLYPPTHLFRCNSNQQIAFFDKFRPNLVIRSYKVYETGWPYSNGGLIKRFISKISIAIGGKKIFKNVFGNRFAAILVNNAYE
jgi:SAM-dependent methyltransferase